MFIKVCYKPTMIYELNTTLYCIEERVKFLVMFVLRMWSMMRVVAAGIPRPGQVGQISESQQGVGARVPPPPSTIINP